MIRPILFVAALAATIVTGPARAQSDAPAGGSFYGFLELLSSKTIDPAQRRALLRTRDIWQLDKDTRQAFALIRKTIGEAVHFSVLGHCLARTDRSAFSFARPYYKRMVIDIANPFSFLKDPLYRSNRLGAFVRRSDNLAFFDEIFAPLGLTEVLDAAGRSFALNTLASEVSKAAVTYADEADCAMPAVDLLQENALRFAEGYQPVSLAGRVVFEQLALVGEPLYEHYTPDSLGEHQRPHFINETAERAYLQIANTLRQVLAPEVKPFGSAADVRLPIALTLCRYGAGAVSFNAVSLDRPAFKVMHDLGDLFRFHPGIAPSANDATVRMDGTCAPKLVTPEHAGYSSYVFAATKIILVLERQL